MQQYEEYTIEKKKTLGVFYTPKPLADYLAKVTLSLCKLDSAKEQYSVLDPATGDSALLIAFYEAISNKNTQTQLYGIDVEKDAVKRSTDYFADINNNAHFFQLDALYPVKNQTSKNGWKQFIDSNLPNGIDFIVCNPPWGAEKDQYTDLDKEFVTATGQFDIYDLFIELVVNMLNDNGCFGIIVPDSIYCEEHTPIRKYLLDNTTIKRIVRLGEGIFPDINIAVSLIFGIKKKSNNTKVICSHLSNEMKKSVLSNAITIKQAVDSSATKILQKTMIAEEYKFLTDVKSTDNKLLNILNHSSKIGDVAQSHRGIELSKKGVILKCDSCGKWFPKPRGHKKEVECPHCKSRILTKQAEENVIIAQKASKDATRIVVGEDILRYNIKGKSYIRMGFDGVNYKDENIYTGSKVLIRKTGVGITAGMDYNNCMTNQVVYILKRKDTTLPSITNEVLLAVLNSRVTTYYIIKTLGSNGWKSNAYLTQKDIMQMPFPIINDNTETTAILARVTALVKGNVKANDSVFPNQIDAEIECLISQLFGLNETDYDIIFQAINEVQQMIPFRRLLTITKEDIFRNGI